MVLPSLAESFNQVDDIFDYDTLEQFKNDLDPSFHYDFRFLPDDNHFQISQIANPARREQLRLPGSIMYDSEQRMHVLEMMRTGWNESWMDLYTRAQVAKQALENFYRENKLSRDQCCIVAHNEIIVSLTATLSEHYLSKIDSEHPYDIFGFYHDLDNCQVVGFDLFQD